MSKNNGHKEAGLCVLALHPALYPSDTTDTTDTLCGKYPLGT